MSGFHCCSEEISPHRK
ncbi:rCG54459 [Rattus norvegicus]|uniref:RCG54459 n=1 Tax=Rattus norvegicus TaxID=10116 RepID=A6JAB2_RAT|nr:rCG54459 [Rattus norvegicus]